MMFIFSLVLFLTYFKKKKQLLYDLTIALSFLTHPEHRFKVLIFVFILFCFDLFLFFSFLFFSFLVC